MRKHHSEPIEYSPQDTGTYQTGHTDPPKYYRGIIATLMIAVIFLGGLASALGVLNVRLLLEAGQRNAEQAPVSVFVDGKDDPNMADATAGTPPALPEDASVELPLAAPAELDPPSDREILARNASTAVKVQGLLCSGAELQLSGIIVDTEGYILTGAAIQDAECITVHLSDGRSYPAAFVGADGFTDLAVVYIRATGLTAAEFVDSDQLRTGDFLATVTDGTALTDGALQSNQHRCPLGDGSLTLMQTGFQAHQGPIYNGHGQLAGFSSPFLEGCCGSKESGLALSSTTVKAIVEQLVAYGCVIGRPCLGVELEELDISQQQYFDLPSGLWVTQVNDSVALRAGDILMALDGHTICDWQSYYRALWNLHPGQPVLATVYRDGQPITLELTVCRSGE